MQLTPIQAQELKMRTVWAQTCASSKHKLVLVHLATNSGPYGFSARNEVSNTKAAAECGLSLSEYVMILRQLQGCCQVRIADNGNLWVDLESMGVAWWKDGIVVDEVQA